LSSGFCDELDGQGKGCKPTRLKRETMKKEGFVSGTGRCTKKEVSEGGDISPIGGGGGWEGKRKGPIRIIGRDLQTSRGRRGSFRKPKSMTRNCRSEGEGQKKSGGRPHHGFTTPRRVALHVRGGRLVVSKSRTGLHQCASAGKFLLYGAVRSVPGQKVEASDVPSSRGQKLKREHTRLHLA